MTNKTWVDIAPSPLPEIPSNNTSLEIHRLTLPYLSTPNQSLRPEPYVICVSRMAGTQS